MNEMTGSFRDNAVTGTIRRKVDAYLERSEQRRMGSAGKAGTGAWVGRQVVGLGTGLGLLLLLSLLPTPGVAVEARVSMRVPRIFGLLQSPGTINYRLPRGLNCSPPDTLEARASFGLEFALLRRVSHAQNWRCWFNSVGIVREGTCLGILLIGEEF